MEPAVVVTLVTPLIGLGGVLLGLWLGQRRWAQEQKRKDLETFSSNLESTYLELWDVVEDLHLRMRNLSDGLNSAQFAGYIAD